MNVQVYVYISESGAFGAKRVIDSSLNEERLQFVFATNLSLFIFFLRDHISLISSNFFIFIS